MHALARYYALPSLSLRDALWEPPGHGGLGYSNASASAQRGGRGGSMGGSSSSGGSTDRSGQAVLGQAATYHSWPPTAP